jgi:hypothetical protein
MAPAFGNIMSCLLPEGCNVPGEPGGLIVGQEK